MYVRTWQQTVDLLTNSLLVLCAFALPISTSVTDIVFPLAVMLSVFGSQQKTKWLKIFSSPVAISLIIFFLLFVIGTSYTIAPWHDLNHRLLQILCLAFSALLIGHVTDEKWRSRILNAFLLSMVITLFLSYLKYFIYHPSFLHAYFHFSFHLWLDESSVFKDHIIQNFLMVIAVFIFIYRWRRHWSYPALTLLGTFNILFMSSGRSGYFIFAALLLYTSLIYFGRRGLIYGTLLMIALGTSAYLLSTEFKTRLLAIEQNAVQYTHGKDQTSIGVRLQSDKNALHLFMQHPWAGQGTGSFATAYAALPAKMIGESGLVPLSYNNYLNVAVELGVIGLAFFILIFALQWRHSFYLVGEWRYLTQILLVTMIVGCLANPWLSDTTELHFYALFLAMGFSTLPCRFKLPDTVVT